MKRVYTVEKRVLAMLLCIAIIAAYLPGMPMRAAAAVQGDAVADPGTAYTWETMMGTDADGNRYAGRVWVDRSTYLDGDTAVLNTSGKAGSSFEVSLADDEAFQVIFSALGSTMSSTEVTRSTGPMDVVLVLDNSVSMNTTSGGTTRMQKVIEAANQLLTNLLDNNDVRLGITAYAENASTVLPFGTYDNGVVLKVNRYTGSGSSNGVITAYNDNDQVINSSYKSNGYANYTNTQAGFDLAMEMLAGASDTAKRKPVVILLTDGAANTAKDTLYMDGYNATVRQVYYSNDIDPMIALSTLLSAAYNKAAVEDHYGKAPVVYGVGVDLSSTDGSNAIIDPGANFNADNSNANIREAYDTYVNTWLTGSDVSETSGGSNFGWGSSSYTFRFGHDYPQSGITDSDISANINYVDTYYPVASSNLQSVFDQIYQELSSAAFNPISSTTVVEGGTGVENTPLIYVDFIGQHMEVKEIQAVTLFGASYDVIKNPDGTYTVDTATGTNPTTKEAWNTAQDIRISITEEADGTQKLEIRIDQEILPIIMEHVDIQTVGNITTSTITEFVYDPLRVYYTVGLDSEILLPNGKIDVSKIRGYGHIDDAAGTVTFYGSQYGEENPADNSGTVQLGDAHVGFQPSAENRYYYHQSNQGIFTQITRKTDGSTVTINPNNEYGIVWDKSAYDLTWMTYADYLAAKDDDKVYTYVTYNHPTADTTDDATAAEEVTYLVYTEWRYLKESVAFYDNATGQYLNDGKVATAAMVAAYLQSNPNAELYAVLGVGSLRTSRLHNMTVEKDSNDTDTAQIRYAPTYTYERALDHNDNDVVVWLGNNAKLTVDIETGIALTKAVTETIGNAGDTYTLTVTVPAGVVADPAVADSSGNPVNFTYSNNVLAVGVKAGQTVYISGIPAGTVCEIDEVVDGDYYKVASQSTASVTVPTLSQVLDTANPVAQFVPAVITNAPNKYGDLTVIKDIDHNFADAPAAMADKVFTFKVQLPAALAGQTYGVDAANASRFTGTQITVGADGSFTVELKNDESITILGLPEGTDYTVTETSTVAGYTDTTGTVSDTVDAGGDHDAHFVNQYGYTAIKPQVTVTGTKILNDVNGTYDVDKEDFTFVLSHYIGSGYEELARTTAKAGDSYQFLLDEPLTESLGIGEHYFRVTEAEGTTDGMSYDSTRGLFLVRITDNDADGTLEYAVENTANTTVSGTTVTKNFTNIYDVQRTHADINITKELTNETGVAIALNSFHFALVNKNDANDTYEVTTDASGKATIRLSELAQGEYTYTLTEVGGALAGMHYDTAPRTVVVTVVENGGVLTAAVKIDDVATNEATFRNTYELNSVSHTVSGTKVLEGRAPVNDEFTFELYETDTTFAITGSPKETVKNVGGSFTFSSITYTQIGTHYYVVREVDKNADGVTYDTTHYHITVTVTVDGKNLVKSVAVNKIGHNSDTSGDIVFVNSYEAAPTEYTFQGVKVLHGRAPRAGEFTFELYEGQTRMETVTNKGDGSFAFTPVSFTAPGTYTFTVVEAEPAANEKAPGVAYTGVNEPVTVTVEVVDENAELKVEAVAVEDKNGTQMPQGIRFENTYTPAAAQVTFSGTKTLEGADLADNTFTFKLYETDHTFGVEGITGTAVKNSGSSFGFEPITITAAGTYFYTLAEDASDPIENVVYDRTRYNYMVHVSDIGDGQLRAVITDMTTGVSSESNVSVSTEASFTNATFAKAAEKEVFGADGTTSVDGKKVNPGDTLTYAITYTNYTGEAVEVDIMDTVPQHTAYVEGSASHGGTYAGGHVNWVLNVAKGESVTVSFQVKVDADGGTINNTAVILDGVNTYTTNEVTSQADKPVPPTDPQPQNPTQPTEPKPQESTQPSAPATQPTETPRTGDSFNAPLIAGLMVLSVTCLAVLVICRKKAQNA